MNDSVVVSNNCNDEFPTTKIVSQDATSLDSSTNSLVNGDSQHQPVSNIFNSIYENGNLIVSSNDSEFISEVEIVDADGEEKANALSSNENKSDVLPFKMEDANSQHQNHSSTTYNCNESRLNNPKKYGKFRILVNNDTNSINSVDHLNSQSVNGLSNGDYSNDVKENSDVVSTSESNHLVKSESQQISKPKRRGRPKKQKPTESDQITNNKIDINNEIDINILNECRRRSSRIRNIEEKKECSKGDINILDSNLVDSSNSNINSCESKMHELSLSKTETSCEQPIEETHKVGSPEHSSFTKSSKSKKKSKHKSKKSEKLKSHKSKKEKSKSSKTNKENNANHDSHSNLDQSSNKSFILPLPPNTQNLDNLSNYQTSPIKTDSDESSSRPEKVKSRWRRNSELENNVTPKNINEDSNEPLSGNKVVNNFLEKDNTPLPEFELLEENVFLFERKKCKTKKETKKMVCDCILTKEERARGLNGCGDDCLNRMLMIECSSKCSLEENCSNKRFQMKQYAKVQPFKTSKKGWGLRALQDISPYTFIMEYVGEVIDPFDFHKRVEKYAKQKKEHHYFMALKSDEIIDATNKGNITRFINHSCDPNSETQKWTVNGELRIGFFTFKHVNAGEEITFDYQFQRYGKKAQKCFCESANCRGYIGSRDNANILTDGSKIPKNIQPNEHESDEDNELDEEKEELPEDLMVENEIELFAQYGIRNRQQVILVSRLMLKTDKCDERIKIVDIIMSINEIAYLRLFIDYHGLKIIWSWMVEAEDIELKARLLELLEILPIPNKTVLIESKVLSIVERWAQKDSLESQQYFNINEDNKDSTKVENDIVKVESTESPIKLDEVAEKSKSIAISEEPIQSDSKPPDDQVNKDESSITKPISEKITTDLSKLSAKIVIKSKSKSTETPVSNQKGKSNLTIGYLAQKLLSHWKDLKEAYIIPRLKRQKRHDDEAEADRRTKEDEERRARGLPIVTEKRAIDDKDYTIAGILGNKRRCLKRLTDSSISPQFFISNSSNQTPSNNNVAANNSLQTSNVNKLSKEDHRKLFEYHVAHNDYRETLKKYYEDLEKYRNHLFQNLQAIQQTDTNVPGFNEVFQYSNDVTNSYKDQYPQLSNFVSTETVNSNNVYSNSTYTGQSTDLVNATETLELAFIENNCAELIPKMQNPLITVCDRLMNEQNLSPYAIDNVDYNDVNYASDNCIESMEKKMFDEVYPPAGIFFITKTGKTYFIALPDDSSSELNVKENVTEPLPLSLTKQLPDDIMPYSWKYSNSNGDYFYYNKQKHIKQWLPPQDCQIDNFDDQRIDMLEVSCDQSQPSSTSSPNTNCYFDKDKDSDISHEELSELKRKNQRRLQEQFRNKISQFIVKCLNPYNKSSCKKARIVTNSDFKYLARKLTHTVVAKELKQCKHLEDLACTESVKHKTKEYVKRYMSRFGHVYRSDSAISDKLFNSPSDK